MKEQNRHYKIVYCTPALYSAGGTERVVTMKANYFADYLNCDVTIIVTEGNGDNSFFPLSQKVKVVNLGIGFEDLWNVSFYKKVFLYLRKQRIYQKNLTRELMKIRPDITITTLRREVNFLFEVDDGSYKIGELHLSRANFRSIDKGNTNLLRTLFYKWWKKRSISLFGKFDRFVVLTESAVAEWPELKNVRMIPDPLSIQPSSSKLKAKRILAIGRYSNEKGYDMLLKIWSIVEKEFKDWRLDIYGMGDPTPYVKMMDDYSIDPKRCRLNSSIVSVEDVYRRSSVLVQPSRTEGFGLVLIEAMSCGLPVVSFDCENGPRSIISDGEDGFLVPAFNIPFFAECLKKLMADKSLRMQMGKNGIAKAKRYGIDAVGQKWKCLFDELMQR